LTFAFVHFCAEHKLLPAFSLAFSPTQRERWRERLEKGSGERSEGESERRGCGLPGS